ncbi:MAG: mercury resistance protein [Nitrospinae bacterium]|nr:mercury resistance protein [Nitrospinota bacterium]
MQNQPRSRSLKGWMLVVTGVLACPCHLPLLGVALTGTVLGGVLREHFHLIVPLAALYFVVALMVGIKLLTPIRPGGKP